MATRREKTLEILTREQRAHLIERINAKHKELCEPYGYRFCPKKPPHVVAAQKQIEAWENARDKTRQDNLKRIGKRTTQVKEDALFAEPKLALALVKQFEAIKP